jgi:hypothetical protein
MPTIPTYTVIQDGPVTIGANLSSDHHFQFNLPDDPGLQLNTAERAVLAFRVNPIGNVKLRVRLDQEAFSQDFDTEPQRSWHEVIPGSALRQGPNELVVSVPSDSPPGGRVTVSDLVLLYKADIPG